MSFGVADSTVPHNEAPQVDTHSIVSTSKQNIPTCPPKTEESRIGRPKLDTTAISGGG